MDDLFKNGMMTGATLLGPFLMGIVSLGIGSCAFGREIAFWPATEFSLNPFSRSSFVDELMVRVDRAKSKRAASRT